MTINNRDGDEWINKPFVTQSDKKIKNSQNEERASIKNNTFSNNNKIEISNKDTYGIAFKLMTYKNVDKDKFHSNKIRKTRHKS